MGNNEYLVALQAHGHRCYAFLLRAAAQAAQQQGVDSKQLLEGTGIDPQVLTDPYQLIDWDQELAFYRNLCQRLPQPGLGLDVGMAYNIAVLGSVGQLKFAEKTIADVINDGQKYLLLLYPHLKWDFIQTDSEIVHRLAEDYPLAELRTFMVERGLALMHRHGIDLVGPHCLPNKVLLDYPEPAHGQKYRDLFQCPVLFDQPVIELHYPSHYLEHALATQDEKVREVLQNLCDTMLVKQQKGQDIVADVRYILSASPGQFPGIEQVAEKLNMSSRTLRRHLTQHQVKFRELLDNARKKLAQEYLVNTQLSIQQIADLCDFSDAQNFAQAFKRWTGQTPTEYRENTASQ